MTLTEKLSDSLALMVRLNWPDTLVKLSTCNGTAVDTKVAVYLDVDGDVVDGDLCYYRVYRMNMPRYRFARPRRGSCLNPIAVVPYPPGKKRRRRGAEFALEEGVEADGQVDQPSLPACTSI